eukprot:TRINITY_DN31695_c0_g1_i1.p1 TRINITY_DN31695_c0_g1~~TRINITY_DN31695_c0_g1_i1.p1  ORF type:complete len:136 (+),score=25.29 TRINITY_DN31695_c0_g1_i1:41-409(+)
MLRVLTPLATKPVSVVGGCPRVAASEHVEEIRRERDELRHQLRRLKDEIMGYREIEIENAELAKGGCMLDCTPPRMLLGDTRSPFTPFTPHTPDPPASLPYHRAMPPKSTPPVHGFRRTLVF